MNTMFDHLDISVNNTPHPLTVMVEDLEAEHSTERWVLAHLTKEEALKMCDRILAEIKSKPDCPKIIIDSVSDFVKCVEDLFIKACCIDILRAVFIKSLILQSIKELAKHL